LKKLLILPFLFVFMYAQNVEKLYEEALNYENNGEYKKAMILYKKIANLKLKKDDEYILDLSKDKEHDVQTFTKLKSDFYDKIIQKSEDKEANESIKQMITGDFGLYPYKMNYLLPVTFDTQERADREQFETKFQFSIEKPISYNFLGLDESISVAYTQKSYWQTSADSSPFRETNYEPEVFIQFPYKNSQTLKGYKIALNHQSNGRNNNDSRSWNRIYLESYLQFSKLFVIPRVWYRIPEKSEDDDNADIDRFLGYGDLTLLYPYKKHTFSLLLRNNLRFDRENKGAAEFNWTFPLPEFMATPNSYGFLQVFTGYGDSLIDYDEDINKVGLGIAFSR